MSSLSTYQPFLIGEGQSKTGLFQYLESWVKPGDAFDTLQDAYVFRGSIYKRQGMAKYPSTAGAGSLVYANSSIVVTSVSGAPLTYNSGGTNASVIPTRPIIAGSVIIYARTSGGVERFVDNGLGGLVGSLGGTGTIDYTSGAWMVDANGAATFNTGTEIWATYSFAVKYVTTGGPFRNPIMGIKLFTNEATNAQVLVVMDTRRASYHNGTTFVAINTVGGATQPQVLGAGDGVANPQLFTAPFGPTPAATFITPFTVTISDGINSITDLGNGTLTTAGNMIGPNTINYSTGAISLALTAPNTRTYTIAFTLVGDYFTGNNTNFFNSAMWKPRDNLPGLLYLTNNVDRVTTFDGNSLSRPPFSITLAHYLLLQNDIAKTLDVKVYKNSLLFLRPTIVGANAPEAQMIRSSIPATSPNFSISDFVSDISGHGAATPCPTGDWIMSAQFLRDAIVVFFLNSTWLFRFTGSQFDPFRFDQLNSSKSTQAPYGSIAYDLQCTSMGNKGLIYCDGVNVERYDINIIDQFLEIESVAFGQCFGQRFDILQQSWMLYPGVGDATGANLQLTSSRVLVYNFLESTWAIYHPILGNTEADATIKNTLSCLGLGFTTTDLTWASFAPGSGQPSANKTWAQWDEAWDSYLDLAQQPALLGGDQNGWVLELNVTNTDDGNVFESNLLTKRFNPFMPAQKATFGYLDVYYEVADEVTLTFSFYANNSSAATLTKQMVLTGSGSNNYFWQRIFLGGLVGEFLQIRITDNGVSAYKILGMILHAAPAGRLTPGSFL